MSLPPKPEQPNFSSGPCQKRPGYSLAELEGKALLGRSHRSPEGLSRIQETMNLTKEILGLPKDYLVGIVPASDTGAVEMCMWSLLGERPVDICFWEAFGKGWWQDATTELLKMSDKLPNFKVNKISSDYGKLPDFSKCSPAHDIIFTWNGTTSGARCPNADWIADDREGITICDATSAIFAMPLPYHKLDVITYSWQKVLGGEGAHGVVIMSPKAVKRLESYEPPWPMPKIFRMKKGDKIMSEIFEGSTINTPSMLCVEDALDGLKWVKSIGGLDACIEKSMKNFRILSDYVNSVDFLDFLCEKEEERSNTSVCLKLKDRNEAQVKVFCKFLAAEKVAFDIASYRDAPPGIRVWCGSTIDEESIRRLLPWLKIAYDKSA